MQTKINKSKCHIPILLRTREGKLKKKGDEDCEFRNYCLHVLLFLLKNWQKCKLISFVSRHSADIYNLCIIYQNASYYYNDYYVNYQVASAMIYSI